MADRLDTMARTQRIFAWALVAVLAAVTPFIAVGLMRGLGDPAVRTNILAGLPYALGTLLAAILITLAASPLIRRAYAKVEPEELSPPARWLNRLMPLLWLLNWMLMRAPATGRKLATDGVEAVLRDQAVALAGFVALLALMSFAAYWGTRRIGRKGAGTA